MFALPACVLRRPTPACRFRCPPPCACIHLPPPFPTACLTCPPFTRPLPSKIGERFCDKLGGKADSGEVVKARNSFGEEGIGTLLSAPVLSAKDSVGLSKLVGVFVFVIAHG